MKKKIILLTTLLCLPLIFGGCNSYSNIENNKVKKTAIPENEINKNEPSYNINYSFDTTYSYEDENLKTLDNSNVHYLFGNWSDYKKDWKNIQNEYPLLLLDQTSYLEINGTKWNNPIPTNLITTDKEDSFQAEINSEYMVGFWISFSIIIWIDDKNIYFRWFLNGYIPSIGSDIDLNIKLNQIHFHLI